MALRAEHIQKTKRLPIILFQTIVRQFDIICVEKYNWCFFPLYPMWSASRERPCTPSPLSPRRQRERPCTRSACHPPLQGASTYSTPLAYPKALPACESARALDRLCCWRRHPASIPEGLARLARAPLHSIAVPSQKELQQLRRQALDDSVIVLIKIIFIKTNIIKTLINCLCAYLLMLPHTH